MNKSYKKSEIFFLVCLGVFPLLIAGFAIREYRANFGTSYSPNAADWGQFGDYFGGLLNPFVALAALIALVWALYVHDLSPVFSPMTR